MLKYFITFFVKILQLLQVITLNIENLKVFKTWIKFMNPAL
jgi:hypothetical protein